MTKVTWNTQKVVKSLQGRIQKATQAAANELKRLVVANITKQRGSPSLPGQYPATQTGAIARSIKVEKVGTGKRVVYRVVARAKHAGLVEKMRPFLKRTARENRDRLKKILVSRMKG